MDCPFCGKEMKEGTIPSGNRLEWVDGSGAQDSWKGVALNGFFGGNVAAFLCPDCRRIILPVPEKAEGVLDLVDRKLDEMSGKLDAAKKQWESRRAQEKEEKRKKEFGSKDPWEL